MIIKSVARVRFLMGREGGRVRWTVITWWIYPHCCGVPRPNQQGCSSVV